MTATAKKGKHQPLLEAFTLEEAMNGVQIDDANGVIKGVAMLTGLKESANKTYYTEKALAEAQTRYEGAKMFIDHPAPDKRNLNRSIQDFGGVYKDVRIDGGRVRGDLHLVESKRATVMAIAKMRPQGIGFSIKDRGFGTEKDGVLFVEGFDPKATFSIDMVCEPSTNKDLFEASQNEGGDDMEFKALTLETLNKERPDLIESAQNAGKAAILKELDESKAAGEKYKMAGAKLLALVEADFTKDIREAVKQMIMPDEISLDSAKAIIKGQKELVEAISKKTTTNGGKPVVTGLGKPTEKEIEEAANSELPSDDVFASAFRS